MAARSPLDQAVARGNVEIISALLAAGADPGATLAVAAGRGEGSVIGLLLAHGADANMRTPLGHTPLHLAVAELRLEAVRDLLLAMADVNAQTPDGNTPLLQLLAALKHQAILQEASRRGIVMDAYWSEYWRNHGGELRVEVGSAQPLVWCLLMAGSDVDLADVHGLSPSHFRGAICDLLKLRRNDHRVTAPSEFVHNERTHAQTSFVCDRQPRRACS